MSAWKPGGHPWLSGGAAEAVAGASTATTAPSAKACTLRLKGLPLDPGLRSPQSHNRSRTRRQGPFSQVAYGDRATLQVLRGEVADFKGVADEVDPNAVPDVGERPAAA